MVACSVLSGNRNFEGRVSPHTKANYLASPPLVVAYALAGTTDIDLTSDPLGADSIGKPVYLRDIWPTRGEIDAVIAKTITPAVFQQQYADVFTGPPQWRELATGGGDVYEWTAQSTYIQEPPFFVDLTPEPQPISPIEQARCLVMVGDSTTTDHISPAGVIAPDSPAGRFLQGQRRQRGGFQQLRLPPRE